MTNDQQKWDKIYRNKAETKPIPATVLSQYAHLLPSEGTALDLACGIGGNAFFLADKGLHVDAWDISPVVIEQVKNNIGSRSIQATVVDINEAPFPTKYYDVITVSRFLNRNIIPHLIGALKKEGLIFYQTFTLEKAQTGGPSNPTFLLKKSELLTLFSSLSPVIYHEEACIGDITMGIRNEALLIAKKA
jgi:SAM-dependent methyltransferase